MKADVGTQVGKGTEQRGLGEAHGGDGTAVGAGGWPDTLTADLGLVKRGFQRAPCHAQVRGRRKLVRLETAPSDSQRVPSWQTLARLTGASALIW